MTHTDQPSEDLAERLRQVAEEKARFEEERDKAQAALDASRARTERMRQVAEDINDRWDRSEPDPEPGAPEDDREPD